MPARRPQIVPQRGTGLVRSKFQDPDPAHGMSHDRTETAVSQLETSRPTRNAIVFTLVAGANRVHHGLGRVPKGCHVTPTVVDAAFAWAMTSADGNDIVVTTAGSTQTNAVIEVF